MYIFLQCEYIHLLSAHIYYNKGNKYKKGKGDLYGKHIKSHEHYE